MTEYRAGVLQASLELVGAKQASVEILSWDAKAQHAVYLTRWAP